MQGFYFSASNARGETLYLSPITNRIIEQSKDEIEDTSGYFLYQVIDSKPHNLVNILAQIHSDDAALKMRDVLGLA